MAYANASTDPYPSPEVPYISTSSQADNVEPSQRDQEVSVATISWTRHDITFRNFGNFPATFNIPELRGQNEHFSPPPTELPQNIVYYEGSAEIPNQENGGNHSGLRFELDNKFGQVRRIVRDHYEFDITRILINNDRIEAGEGIQRVLEHGDSLTYSGEQMAKGP